MTRKESSIAAIIFTMLALSGALLLWGMRLDNAADRIGPIRSVSIGGTDHLAVFFGGELHLLDRAGKRVSRQRLSELVLTEEPNDMDWTVDASGKVQAWFFEDTTPRLVRCDLAVAGTRLERCAQLVAGPQLKADAASRAVHMAVDVARQRVFVADAKGHAVRALGFDGKFIGGSASGALYFPNRVRLAGDQLVVADNDHRRLVWLDVGGDQPSFAVRRTLQASVHPQARSGHTKVTDFAVASSADGALSALWMLAVAQGQKDGDVLTWGPGLKPVARADLGRSADPLAIDRLGDVAVVSDFDGVALTRVDAAGKSLGPFGDATFEAELRASRDRVADGAMWIRAGWMALGLSMAIGFLLAWRYSEKPGRQASMQAFAGLALIRPETPRGRVELFPEAWFFRQSMRSTLAVSAVVILSPLLLFLLPDGAGAVLLQSTANKLRLGLVLLVWVSLPLTLWWTHRARQQTLVVQDGTVEVLAGGRVKGRSPVSEVLASPQSLLIGRAVLAYRTRKPIGAASRWIYSEDQLSRYLLAHLPDSQRMAQAEFGRALMKRMPVWRKVLIGAMLVVCVAFQLYLAFR